MTTRVLREALFSCVTVGGGFFLFTKFHLSTFPVILATVFRQGIIREWIVFFRPPGLFREVFFEGFRGLFFCHFRPCFLFRTNTGMDRFSRSPGSFKAFSGFFEAYFYISR